MKQLIIYALAIILKDKWVEKLLRQNIHNVL
jgi:hypothetical protein